MSDEKSRKALEARARRAAKRAGCFLKKGRSRTIHLDDFGDFMIVNARSGFVVDGARFDMSAEEVLEYFAV